MLFPETEATRRPGSLDAVILVCKLVIEAKLIHEMGCHLLDLVLRECLGEWMPP